MPQTRITATFEFIKTDAWLNAVRSQMYILFIKAARQFLLEAVPRVPIRTGHSRSGFKNLEDIAGQVTKDRSSTRGVRIRTDRRGGRQVKILRREYYYPPSGGRILKTTQSGRQFATQPDSIIDIKGIKLASGRLAFYFKFEIDITYFNFLDKSKWHSFEEGTKAFENYVKDNIDSSIPDIENFLVRKRVQ